jgi:hypothetical protein
MITATAKTCLLLLLAFAIPLGAGAAPKEKNTIKSLDKKSVNVRPGKLIVDSSD